jgi:hypothetical protein
MGSQASARGVDSVAETDMPIHGPGVERTITTAIIVCLTIAGILLGDVAGLGPPEWPTPDTFFSFG